MRHRESPVTKAQFGPCFVFFVVVPLIFGMPYSVDWRPETFYFGGPATFYVGRNEGRERYAVYFLGRLGRNGLH